MKKTNRIRLSLAAALLLAFVLWTHLVCVVDVQPIGPLGTSVGFAALNGYVHTLTGVNMFLYTVTDWLSIVPIGTALGFAVLGLCQWISRRRLCRTDRSLRAMGVFYLVVMMVYIFFEQVVINCRPILIGGYPEASYPSSTTMLVLCVMPAARIQLNARIKNRAIRRGISALMMLFMGVMVIGRLLSGVHWVTDILGSVFISAGLVLMFRPFIAE